MKTMEPVTYKRVSRGCTNRTLAGKYMTGASCAAAIIGLLISRGNILGCMAPLGLAWCAAVCTAEYGIPVLLGSMLGICFMNMGYVKLKYIAAVGIFGILKRYYKTDKWEKSEFRIGVMCGLNLLCSAGVTVIRGFLYYDLAVTVFECAAIWASGIIFSKTERVLKRGGQVVSDEETIAVAIMTGAAVAGLEGINIFGIKPANILSMYIILFTAFKGGVGISGAVGAALGIISAMSQGDAPALCGVYAFVGLTAGVMNIFGKLGVAAAAVCANAVFSAYYNSSVIVLINIFEIIIAGTAFYFTPDKLLGYIEKYSIKIMPQNPASGQALSERIKTMNAFEGIKYALCGMSRAFETETDGENDSRMAVLCERTAAKVCDSCSLNKYCWTRNLKNTSELFQTITKNLENGEEEKIAETVTGRCVRGEMLASTAIGLYDVYRRENLIENRSREYTRCARQQWSKLLKRVEELENEARAAADGDEELAETVSRSLAVGGIGKNITDVRKNSMGMFEVTVKTKNQPRADILQPIEEALNRNMAVTFETVCEDGYITFAEENTNYDYEIATVAMDKMNTDISGDNCKYFTRGGVMCCAISDGMGSGEAAARESANVTDIFGDLVMGGFSLGEAAEIINAGLMGGEHEESCATLDCISINLYSGKAQMLKAGGVATIVKANDETQIIRMPAMPLGILNEGDTRETYIDVNGDTYFVMMTDGVPDNTGDREYGENFVKNIVSASSDSSAKEMADNIMMSAISSGKPKDDMMVTVIKIFSK